MIRVLIIDDEADAIAPLREDIEETDLGACCTSCDFAEAEERIADSPPDVVVLDLLQSGGAAEHLRPGLGTRDFIWKNHFCPIIVHSAEPDHHVKSSEEHPFMKSIKKGRESTAGVIQALREFNPQIQALKKAKKEIENSFGNSFSQAMRDVAPQVFKETDAEARQARIDAIKRAGIRRLAVLMDGQSDDGILAPWEMYLCPPISKHIKLGDLIKRVSSVESETAAPSEPSDFFLVLTPSCDLVEEQDRDAKVQNILVAQCGTTEQGLYRTSLKDLPRSDRKAKDLIRKSLLTAGHLDGVIPFPSYRDKIPTMTADLRNLNFVPIKNIGTDKEYERVASVDSPFRELISWAYMQIACRMGLPERSFEDWSTEILRDRRDPPES